MNLFVPTAPSEKDILLSRTKVLAELRADFPSSAEGAKTRINDALETLNVLNESRLEMFKADVKKGSLQEID